jgi:NADH dehydrogenase
MRAISNDVHVVTGAFGYTGRYIAARLLAAGRRVRTLTAHPNRPHPFGVAVEVAPLDFTDPDRLARDLEGAAVLYNTYWVRFAYGDIGFDSAIANTRTLVEAAQRAGVQRIVHISIANPSLDSALPYYHGKAAVEGIIGQSGLSYAIIRPTVIFGFEDILISNIAWLLRRFPIFAIAGRGDYGLQPVFVEDVAEIAVRAADGKDNVILDAAGPEIFTFAELVRLIRDSIGSRARIVPLSPRSTLLLAKLAGYFVRDVLLTRDELDGLMANLLVSKEAPLGQTRFTDWLRQNAAELGRTYASELDRHYRSAV